MGHKQYYFFQTCFSQIKIYIVVRWCIIDLLRLQIVLIGKTLLNTIVYWIIWKKSVSLSVKRFYFHLQFSSNRHFLHQRRVGFGCWLCKHLQELIVLKINYLVLWFMWTFITLKVQTSIFLQLGRKVYWNLVFLIKWNI